MAFQLSDDIMDLTSSELELGKRPGVDMREGVYTLPVLHALAFSSQRDELAELLTSGPPDGRRLDRAIEIILDDGSIEHARSAVTSEVTRAVELARRLPDGSARGSLIQLANVLAVRCGAGLAP
jgi:heptaprenyl diphosphate synthase